MESSVGLFVDRRAVVLVHYAGQLENEHEQMRPFLPMFLELP